MNTPHMPSDSGDGDELLATIENAGEARTSCSERNRFHAAGHTKAAHHVDTLIRAVDPIVPGFCAGVDIRHCDVPRRRTAGPVSI
jgi:hypothetical protein